MEFVRMFVYSNDRNSYCLAGVDTSRFIRIYYFSIEYTLDTYTKV